MLLFSLVCGFSMLNWTSLGKLQGTLRFPMGGSQHSRKKRKTSRSEPRGEENKMPGE
jgi:hypothetical protein